MKSKSNNSNSKNVKPVNIPRGETAIICSTLNKFKTCDLISQETYNLIFERLNLPEKHKIVSYDTKKESKDFKPGCKPDDAITQVIKIGFKSRLDEMLQNEAITSAAYEQAIIQYNL